ncbi:MAG: ABC transporter substrate-binding protein, partial [Finegoldia magna]|nr:ABC transporter substrate-binding protein [Finegoldia magna]
MKKYFKILMCIAVIALSFTACQSKSDDKSNDSTTKKTEEKKEGANNYKDTLNIAVTAQPPTLDPVMTASNLTLAISNNFYETLFTFDENYNQTPMLAESYTKNDNNTEFTFKLRKGIKFHNDKEMKADDVASSMNYWLTKSERAKNLIGEGKFEKVDDYTVKATFKQPA